MLIHVSNCFYFLMHCNVIEQVRVLTKKKRDCCHKSFNTTFLGKLQIVPFQVLPF